MSYQVFHLFQFSVNNNVLKVFIESMFKRIGPDAFFRGRTLVVFLISLVINEFNFCLFMYFHDIFFLDNTCIL